jgi:hypothetical protein
VRTTITLDEDVARHITQRMRETGASFKETVNDVLRLGLIEARNPSPAKPFQVKARSLGLREGLSYDNVEDLLDQLDGVFRR